MACFGIVFAFLLINVAFCRADIINDAFGALKCATPEVTNKFESCFNDYVEQNGQITCCGYRFMTDCVKNVAKECGELVDNAVDTVMMFRQVIVSDQCGSDNFNGIKCYLWYATVHRPIIAILTAVALLAVLCTCCFCCLVRCCRKKRHATPMLPFVHNGSVPYLVLNSPASHPNTNFCTHVDGRK